jgi:hypothetical protein
MLHPLPHGLETVVFRSINGNFGNEFSTQGSWKQIAEAAGTTELLGMPEEKSQLQSRRSAISE